MSSAPNQATSRPASTQKKTKRRGLLLGMLLCALIAYLGLIRDFLSITRPIPGEVLIVESWFPDSPTMKDAAEVIRQGHYRQVLCVALDDSGETGATPNAQQAAQRLITLGVEARLIHVLVVPHSKYHRTYTLGLAAQKWLRRDNPALRAVDVFTIGAHARKTQILYRKAFPPEIAVGIIAGQVTTDYPFSCWWLSPRGIFVIVRNTVGYLYALAYFP